MVNHYRRALCAGIIALAFAGAAQASPDKPVIGVVVKIGGIPWFNAMEAGIKKKAAELGVRAFMVGPTSADPALQVRAVEDLIAQKVDVIGVVPNDAEVLEPVLERARAAPSVPMTMRHRPPGSLALRVLKDDPVHAHDTDPDRR